MSYGITPEGWVQKDFDTIKTEIEAEFRAEYGSDVNLSVEDGFGSLAAIMSRREDAQWKHLEDVWYSLWIDTALGAALDYALNFGGLQRLSAAPSTVTVRFTGTNGTIIPIDFVIGTPDSVNFKTLTSGTISGGFVDISCQCLQSGTISNVLSNKITVIVSTPPVGLTSVTNPSQSIGGREIETDIEAYTRYVTFANTASGTSKDAIYNALILVSGVAQALVEDNETEDYIGTLPPKSVHATVLGGADAGIGSAIMAHKSAGILTFGASSVVITDDQGNPQTVKFDRPTVANIYYIINVTKNASWNAGSVDDIKLALIKYVGGIYGSTSYAGLPIGGDVLHWKSLSALNNIPGADNIQVLLGKSSPPTLSNNIAIGANELARTEVAFITVN